MAEVSFYRDPDAPFFEIKFCDTEELAYHKHYHPEYSLGLVENGVSRFWHEGRETEVYPGSLVIIPPGRFHACNPSDQLVWRYKMLFIDPGWVAPAALGDQECQTLFPASSGEDRFWRQAGAELVACLTSLAAPLEKETRLVSFLTEVFRDQPVTAAPVEATGAERVRLKTVKDYLDSHYSEKVTLADLEQVSGLSRCYLLRLFQREYQVSPHSYQTMRRIDQAKQELRGQKRIAEVAQETGFYDQSHFVKIFRLHTGTSPEMYQKH